MPKSSKRFVLNDDSLNTHYFRVLTEGIDLSQFLKNNIMLFAHNRAHDEKTLPIGYWEDVKVENGQLMGTPFFDDNDDFAMKIYQKVEDGILKMASIGFVPVEQSDAEEHLVPGQKYSTVTKSLLKEVSIVDIGSNNNALALYDHQNALVMLSDENINDFLNPIINNTMKTIELNKIAGQIGLAADKVTPEAVNEKLIELVGNSEKMVKLQDENKKLTEKVAKIEGEQATNKINTLVDKAVADGKITEAQKPNYIKLATADFDTTEQTLSDMKAHKTAESQMADASTGDAADPLLKLSWDEAHKAGKLADIKTAHPEHYASLFEKEHGRKPNA